MYFGLKRLHKQVADVFDEVAAFRRDIHMHPELSEHEACTETKICDWLNALDIHTKKESPGMASARQFTDSAQTRLLRFARTSTHCR